jgi:RNA binding exosome subunit
VSSKPPIAYVDVRVFVHATEDAEKVLAAVRNILPVEVGEAAVFRKAGLSGHHGNPILLFEARLEDKKALPEVLRKFGVGLAALDKEELASELRLHLERRNLYLRFDKQAAFRGKLRFSRVDPIRVRVHFKLKGFDEIVAFCRDVGVLP